MIIKGATLEQVKAAVASFSPQSTVKLKDKDGALHGYITAGGKYLTKVNQLGHPQFGLTHPWQPCVHFYQAFFMALPAKHGVVITLNKHQVKYWNVTSKAQTALHKLGLTCGHGALSPIGIVTATEAAPAVVMVKPAGTPKVFTMLEGAPMEPGDTDQASKVRSLVRPVYAVTTSLYVLEYCKIGAARIPSRASSEIPDHLLTRALHAIQWRNQVTRYAEHFANTLARHFFDYLTMASFGEARYGQGSKYTFDNASMKAGRSHAYQAALRYDPRDMLPKVAYAFNHYAWGGAYGGKKWGKIAETAALYFKPEFRDFPIVFADHCVDLAHNGGLAFNKGYILGNPSNESAYMAMLNSKRNDTFMTQDMAHPITPDVMKFYEQGVSLGVVPRSKAGFKLEKDVEVPTLTWGTEHVAFYSGSHEIDAAKPTAANPVRHSEVSSESYPER